LLAFGFAAPNEATSGEAATGGGLNLVCMEANADLNESLTSFLPPGGAEAGLAEAGVAEAGAAEADAAEADVAGVFGAYGPFSSAVAAAAIRPGPTPGIDGFLGVGACLAVRAAVIAATPDGDPDAGGVVATGDTRAAGPVEAGGVADAADAAGADNAAAGADAGSVADAAAGAEVGGVTDAGPEAGVDGVTDAAEVDGLPDAGEASDVADAAAGAGAGGVTKTGVTLGPANETGARTYIITWSNAVIASVGSN